MENVLTVLKVIRYQTESAFLLMITVHNTDILILKINGIIIGSMVVKRSVKSVIKATI